MRACNIIYWCLIVPILTYGSELWVLKQNDIDALDKFQRYAGKRIQRFPKWTPNETSFRGLGWMRLENYIYAKKLVFLRTIMVRNDNCIYKRILKARANKFNSDIEKHSQNVSDSPIFDILRIAIVFNLYDVVMSMCINDHAYSKTQWKTIIWTRAWQVEDSDWQYGTIFFKSLETINMTIGSSKYLSWWHISDACPSLMKACETMAKLVCRASELKCDNYKFKGSSYYAKSCSVCNLAGYENAEHMIMSCQNNSDLRQQMCSDLLTRNDCRDIWNMVPATSVFKVLLGGREDSMDFESLVPVWCVSAYWIHRMYLRTVEERSGIG